MVQLATFTYSQKVGQAEADEKMMNMLNTKKFNYLGL